MTGKCLGWFLAHDQCLTHGSSWYDSGGSIFAEQRAEQGREGGWKGGSIGSETVPHG